MYQWFHKKYQCPPKTLCKERLWWRQSLKYGDSNTGHQVRELYVIGIKIVLQSVFKMFVYYKNGPRLSTQILHSLCFEGGGRLLIVLLYIW